MDIWTQKFPVDDEYYRRSGTTQLNREVAQNNKNENGSFIMKNAVITSQRNYGWHWYLGSKGTIHYVNKQNTNSYMARDDDHYVYFFSCLFPIFEYFEPPHF